MAPVMNVKSIGGIVGKSDGTLDVTYENVATAPAPSTPPPPSTTPTPTTPPADGTVIPKGVEILNLQDVFNLKGAFNPGGDRSAIKVGCKETGLYKGPTEGDTRLPAGARYDALNRRVILAGTYTGSRRFFTGWDMAASKDYIEVLTPGWTINKGFGGPSTGRGTALNPDNYMIKMSQAAASAIKGDPNSQIIIEDYTIDGHDKASNTFHGSAGIISQVAGVSGWAARRVAILNMAQDDANGWGDDIEFAWCYFGIGGKVVSAHGDGVQFFGGRGLRVNHCLFDFRTTQPTPIEHGRTNCVRLESYPAGKAIVGARVEDNVCIGAKTKDADRAPQYYLFSVTRESGTGELSDNQFNRNAVEIDTALMYPQSKGASGKDNYLLDGTRLPDFVM